MKDGPAFEHDDAAAVGADGPTVVGPGGSGPHRPTDEVEDAQREVRARLRAIEELRDDGVITDEEYQQAREITLLGPAGAASLHGHETAQIPVSTDPEPEPGLKGRPNGGSDGSGRPPWLVPAAAGVGGVAVIAVIVGLFLAFRGDDSNTYVQAVEPSSQQLNASAAVVGRALARVAGPADVASLKRVADRQLETADTARVALGQVQAPADQRAVQQNMLIGAAGYRTYLALLRRSTSVPAEKAPPIITQARVQAAKVTTAFTAVTEAQPGISMTTLLGSGLDATAGLASVRREQAAAVRRQRDAAERRRREADAARAGAADIARVRTGYSFQSPTGNIHCQDDGSQLFCSTSNDTFAVILPSYGASYSSTGVASGGETVPYGGSWRSPSGNFTCSSAYDGITCSNSSGNGFFLNRTTYDPR